MLVKDKNDKQRPVGGDIVVARLIDRVSNRIAAEGHVVDNTDGSYYVSYVPTRCGAELSLRVTVNGTRLLGSPFRPLFMPGPVAGRCCTASGAGLHDGVTGRPCEFQLQARSAAICAQAAALCAQAAAICAQAAAICAQAAAICAQAATPLRCTALRPTVSPVPSGYPPPATAFAPCGYIHATHGGRRATASATQ